MRRTIVQYSASLMPDASVVSGVLGPVGYRDNIDVIVLSSLDGRHTHNVLMRLTRAFARASSATLDGSPVAYGMRDSVGDAEGDAKIRGLGKRPYGVGRHPRGRGD